MLDVQLAFSGAAKSSEEVDCHSTNILPSGSVFQMPSVHTHTHTPGSHYVRVRVVNYL